MSRPSLLVARSLLRATRWRVLAAATTVALGAAITPSVVFGQEGEPTAGIDWPQFRGIGARGSAEGWTTPVHWNGETGENIAWKVPVSGLGHSSPVVWGDTICVTTAVGGGDALLKVGLYGDIEPVVNEGEHQWVVLCFDKHTGTERWTAVATAGEPIIPRHPKSTHANSTLATDGESLVALFGSEGLFSYFLDSGVLRWRRDLGVLRSGFFDVPEALWGYAASPVIYDGLVVVQADVLNESFLVALDADTGDELWRTSRDDVPTWSTPTVHVVDGVAQVIVNGYRHIGGYDLHSGREVWRMEGGGDIPVPTPIVHDGLIFITNAHGPGAPVIAVSDGASGNISLAANQTSNDHVVWSQPRGGGYMPTPLVVDGYLHVLRDIGAVAVYDTTTGRRHYQERVAGGGSGYTASPVAGDGKLYVSSEDGTIHVLRTGPEFQHLAANPMGETLMATPALSEGMLFVRTRGHLVAIAGS